jgi:tetratricopeptide (TPR) repeat protein
MFEGPAKQPIRDFARDLSGKIRLAKKDYPGAISEFLTMTKAEPEEPGGWAYLIYACAQGGKRTEASALLIKLNQLSGRRYVAPYWMAVAWTGLGDHDKAIHFLNESHRLRSPKLATIQVDPLFDPLHPDPRFQELLHEMALPTVSANYLPAN